MAIDPGIALGVRPMQLKSPIEQQTQILTLRDLQSRQRQSQQAEQQQQAEAQQAERAKAALQRIVQETGGLVKDGQPNEPALKRIGIEIDPAFEVHIRGELAKSLPKPAAPAAPQGLMNVGGRVFDPNTRQMVYEPPAEEKAAPSMMNVAPGGTVFDPTTQKPVYTAPERPTEGKPETRSLELQAAEALIKGDQGRYQQIVKAQRDLSAAGRTPQGPGPGAAQWQWVTRNGEDVWTNAPQPGDKKHVNQVGTTETAQDRQRNARVGAAQDFLGRLNELRTKINTKTGVQAGVGGALRQGAAALGYDPDVAEYEKIRAAGGRALAVAIMGAQNLSDADAKSWSDMLPGARVDAVTAERLMTQVKGMLDEMQTAGTKPKAPAGGGKVNMRTPDGRPLSVPLADVERAKKAGAVIVP